jgi:ribose-phosphate pyrophosphokinase
LLIFARINAVCGILYETVFNQKKGIGMHSKLFTIDDLLDGFNQNTNFDLNHCDQSNYIINRFPDAQTNIELKGDYKQHNVNVSVSLDSSEKIMLLLQMVDALKRANAVLGRLTIFYFYGARSDRQMNEAHSSIDALIVANLINSMGFKKVRVLDLHNLEMGLHINNFEAINIVDLFCNAYHKLFPEINNSIRIIPDAGASKKQENYQNIESIQCLKKRNPDGGIDLKIYDIEKVKNKNCFICDDLIDGGGTFIQIAKQLRQNNVRHLVLFCTHAIFSKGVDELTSLFDQIITTNSFTRQPLEALQHPKIDIIDINKLY